MKNKLLNIINKIDLKFIILLIIIIVIRKQIYVGYEDYSIFYDTTTYIVYNANIIKGEVDSLRTPVYPSFLNIIKFFSDSDVEIYTRTVILQEFLSIISVIILYNTLKNIFKNQIANYISIFIYACLPGIFTYNKAILTESFSISFLVIYFCLILKYLAKPTNKKTILIGLFTLLLIMLRPTFIYLIVFLLMLFGLIFVLKKEYKKQAILGFGVVIGLILAILGYCFLNKIQNNIFGISNVTQINQLDTVIKMKIYDTKDIQDEGIIEIINQNLDGDSSHWFRNTTNKIMKEFTPDEIDNYLNRCIKNNFSTYVKLTLKKIITIASSNCNEVYLNVKSSDIVQIIIPFSLIYLYIIFEGCYILIDFIKNKNLLIEQLVALILILGQLSTIILGAQAEYSRLFVSSLPIVIISIGYHIEEILMFVKKDLKRERKFKN